MAGKTLTVPVKGPKTGNAAPSPKSPHMATTTLRVGGMTCGACTSSVDEGFKNVDGVGNVSVSLITERAVVQHDPTRISPEAIAEIIEDRGFDAEVLSSNMPKSGFEDSDDEDDDMELLYDQGGDATTTMEVKGMTCGACTSAIESAFKDVEGVKNFNVSLLSERAVVDHDPSIISSEKLAEIIEDTGFDATVLETKSANAKPRKSKKGKMVTTTVSVEGMTCGACTSAVEAGFKDVEGLVQFNISLLAERAVVVHDPTKLSAEQIFEIIEDRGFDATIISSVSSDAQSSSSVSVPLKIYGLPHPTAATELEEYLGSLPGVTASIKAHPDMARADITHKPSQTGLRAIVEAIEAKGYNALLADGDNNSAQLESLSKTKEIHEWRRAFRTSLAFAIPVFLTTMIFPMFLPFLDYGSIILLPGIYLGDIVAIILTVPVQFGIGKRFYVSAYKSLRHGSPTMDVLVVLGTSAAFFFSIFAMLVSFITPPHTRPATVFDTSTMLITFITLGRYLENSAKGQTSKALSRLMSLTPSMATIYADPIAAARTAEGWSAPVNEDSDEEKQSALAEKVIPTELLELGDMVVLKPGDKIPADGDVTRGQSYVDESMVTGEPMPVLKKTGHGLMAGTVNGAGRIDFVVTRAGRDTQLSQIVRLVQEAQTSRAPIQRMADIVAGYFVPIIVSLGLITFVTWMVLSHTLSDPPKVFTDHKSGGAFMVCLKLCISVIVFACPCALGLSTPTAVMVGTGVGAEQGILVKGGAALEMATKVTHVVLDKTGTLTVGKMTVARADTRTKALEAVTHRSPLEDMDRQRLWWSIVGLAEMGSEHPIAKAVTLAAKDRLNIGPEGSFDGAVTNFDVIVGKGVSATVEPTIPGSGSYRPPFDVLIGNVELLRSHGVEVPSSAWVNGSMDPDADASASMTTIHVAILSTYAGSLALSDRIKPTARACIRALTRMGIKTSIVTGDALPPALAVARAVGVPPDRVHAGKTPEQKQEIVAMLQGTDDDDLEGTPIGGPSGFIGFVLRLIKRRSWREKAALPRDTVAMVGDGINDSPALATAAVGIALASGTDVAMEAASIVLMQSSSSSDSDIAPGSSNDLLALPASLLLSRAIFQRIKLNLMWATCYNFIGLPFAMGIFLPWGLSLHPMAAGAAMACSSVSVVMSSLALKWWKRPKWLTVQALDPEHGSGAPLPRKRRKESWVGKLKDLIPKKPSKKDDMDRGAYVPLQGVEDV